jgi:SnoaL-like protein
MDDALRRLLDRAELEELMNCYAAAIDLRDWARLRGVFADGEIEADFTSMGVKEVFRGPAERWVGTVRLTIEGFDATQHFFANHSAEVDGDRAVDTRYMQARHVLDGAHYTVGGYYTGHMLRTAHGWRIARYRLAVTFTEGDRKLMGVAYRKTRDREAAAGAQGDS